MKKPYKENWKEQMRGALQENAVDYSFIGDMREADRLHFLELNNDSIILLIGGGFGHTVFAASSMCKKVFVLEPDISQYEFLEKRREEYNCENVVLQHVGSQEEIEAFFARNIFDAIIIEEPLQTSIAFYKTLMRSLKSGGQTYIATQKKGSFRFARNLVRHLGLQDVRCMIVLPSHRLPMFFLPIGNISAMRYFFRNLFYLVSTVPPEKRGKYGFFIGMARAAAKIIPVHLLVFLLNMVFKGKAVVARKT